MNHSAKQTRRPELGIVLAGGRGSRMGGDKPWKELAGKRLIDLALEALDRVCPQVAVVTGQVAEMAGLPRRIIGDRWPGQGPLPAIATALLDSGARDILVLAVDMPLVRPGLLELVASAAGAHKAAAPQGPRGPEPLLAYYSRECLPAAQRLMQKDELRARVLLKAVGAHIFPEREVARLDPAGHSFLNVNRPEDLQKAQELMEVSVV